MLLQRQLSANNMGSFGSLSNSQQTQPNNRNSGSPVLSQTNPLGNSASGNLGGPNFGLDPSLMNTANLLGMGGNMNSMNPFMAGSMGGMGGPMGMMSLNPLMGMQGMVGMGGGGLGAGGGTDAATAAALAAAGFFGGGSAGGSVGSMGMNSSIGGPLDMTSINPFTNPLLLGYPMNSNLNAAKMANMQQQLNQPSNPNPNFSPQMNAGQMNNNPKFSPQLNSGQMNQKPNFSPQPQASQMNAGQMNNNPNFSPQMNAGHMQNAQNLSQFNRFSNPNVPPINSLDMAQQMAVAGAKRKMSSAMGSTPPPQGPNPSQAPYADKKPRLDPPNSTSDRPPPSMTGPSTIPSMPSSNSNQNTQSPNQPSTNSSPAVNSYTPHQLRDLQQKLQIALQAQRRKVQELAAMPQNPKVQMELQAAKEMLAKLFARLQTFPPLTNTQQQQQQQQQQVQLQKQMAAAAAAKNAAASAGQAGGQQPSLGVNSNPAGASKAFPGASGQPPQQQQPQPQQPQQLPPQPQGGLSHFDASGKFTPLDPRLWDAKYKEFMRAQGTPFVKPPNVAGRPLEMWHLFYVVVDMGGYDVVMAERKWKDVATRMHVSSMASGHTAVRKNYATLLQAFEKFLIPNANSPMIRGQNPQLESSYVEKPVPDLTALIHSGQIRPPTNIGPPANQNMPVRAPSNLNPLPPNWTAQQAQLQQQQFNQKQQQMIQQQLNQLAAAGRNGSLMGIGAIPPFPNQGAGMPNMPPNAMNMMTPNHPMSTPSRPAALGINMPTSQSPRPSPAAHLNMRPHGTPPLGGALNGSSPARPGFPPNSVVKPPTPPKRPAQPAPPPPPPPKPVYDPMKSARVVTTVGGLDVDKLYSVVGKPTKYYKSVIGPTDLTGLVMALRSQRPVMVAKALNTLAVLTSDREVPIKPWDIPEIVDCLVALMHMALEEQLMGCEYCRPAHRSVQLWTPKVAAVSVDDEVPLDDLLGLPEVDEDHDDDPEYNPNSSSIATPRVKRKKEVSGEHPEPVQDASTTADVVKAETETEPPVNEKPTETGTDYRWEMREFISHAELLEAESDEAVCLMPLEACVPTLEDSRKRAAELASCIGLIFRNWSLANVDCQQWMGRHLGVVDVTLKALRVPCCVKKIGNLQGGWDDGEDEELAGDGNVGDAADDLKTDSKSLHQSEPYPMCAYYTVEQRRNSIVTIMNVGCYTELASKETAQMMIDLLSDLLEFGTSNFNSSLGNVPLDDDLQVGCVLEALTKLSMTIRNADLIAACSNLDILLKRVLRTLPFPLAGPFTNTLTVEDLVKCEFALMVFYNFASFVDGMKSFLVSLPGFLPIMFALSKGSCFIRSKRGWTEADYFELDRQVNPICVRAMKILVECCTSDEGREKVGKFETELVEIVTRTVKGPCFRNERVEALAANYHFTEPDQPSTSEDHTINFTWASAGDILPFELAVHLPPGLWSLQTIQITSNSRIQEVYAQFPEEEYLGSTTLVDGTTKTLWTTVLASAGSYVLKGTFNIKFLSLPRDQKNALRIATVHIVGDRSRQTLTESMNTNMAGGFNMDVVQNMLKLMTMSRSQPSLPVDGGPLTFPHHPILSESSIERPPSHETSATSCHHCKDQLDSLIKTQKAMAQQLADMEIQLSERVGKIERHLETLVEILYEQQEHEE
ncbi:AT-rich interactive domain-containing protein 1B [Chytridiales sp. JEL 0842]|nr:AT-rich interactive domain-containing protein 1B [Chytridiales sp. JEL 0842]